MNAAHKLGRIGNRLRRITRRLMDLNAEKLNECRRAEEQHREPNLHSILTQTNRLTTRQRELES